MLAAGTGSRQRAHREDVKRKQQKEKYEEDQIWKLQIKEGMTKGQSNQIGREWRGGVILPIMATRASGLQCERTLNIKRWEIVDVDTQ